MVSCLTRRWGNNSVILKDNVQSMNDLRKTAKGNQLVFGFFLSSCTVWWWLSFYCRIIAHRLPSPPLPQPETTKVCQIEFLMYEIKAVRFSQGSHEQFCWAHFTHLLHIDSCKIGLNTRRKNVTPYVDQIMFYCLLIFLPEFFYPDR